MTPELLNHEQNKKRLTLYQIEAELLELIELREEMTAEGSMQEELKAINEEIAEYVAMNLKKVDDIRFLMKHCRVMAEAAHDEERTQARRAQVWENRLDMLKDLCKTAMQGWNKKKLEGRTGSIILKGDGGKQAVAITDESLIPDEYCDWVGSFPGSAIAMVEFRMPRDFTAGFKRTPRKAAIAEALNKPCEGCEGKGRWIYPPFEESETCRRCGGSMKETFPGARLEPRGQHVEVK